MSISIVPQAAAFEDGRSGTGPRKEDCSPLSPKRCLEARGPVRPDGRAMISYRRVANPKDFHSEILSNITEKDGERK